MLVREITLFITTCHSILAEDNISAVLRGRFAKLQIRHIMGNDSFFFFFGGGIRISELKKTQASPMLLEGCAWRNTSRHCSRRASHCSHGQCHGLREVCEVCMENLQWQMQVLMRVVRTFTSQLIPFDSALPQCLSVMRCGTPCCWTQHCCACVQIQHFSLKLLFWLFQREAGFSGCPWRRPQT